MFQTLNVSRDRTTADLVDFNGDGLLDIAVTNHQTGYSAKPIDIYLNEGSKEEPKFSSANKIGLPINGAISKYQFCNILFADLNRDNKIDLLFFKGTSKTDVTFHYSLNISQDDSIILGPINNLFINSNHIKMPDKVIPMNVVTTAAGNKVHLAYYDTNNDGIKEFYVNSSEGWHRFYTEGAVNISGKDKFKINSANNVKSIGNKIRVDNYDLNTEISVYDIRGKLIMSQMLNDIGKDEISLKDYSSGAYYVRLKNKNINHVVNIMDIK